MPGNRSIALLALIAGSQLVAGCQAYLPRDETPELPAGFVVPQAIGPSSQRLGEDGYPLIGAYPTAATAQVRPEVVAAQQSRFANAATRAQPADPRGYQQSVAELGAIAAERNRRAAQGRAQAQANAAELRAIAERQQARTAE